LMDMEVVQQYKLALMDKSTPAGWGHWWLKPFTSHIWNQTITSKVYH
jgi:hypothetical protein